MSNAGLANYIHALFLVYYVLLIIRVVFSWIGIPSQKVVLVLFRFVYDVTEPYLGVFRRFLPPMGGIDFSPFIGIILLNVIERIIAGLVVG